MLNIRSIQDGARVLWCVRDLLAAIENTTSVTKYTEKIRAADKVKVALGDGGKNKQQTLFIATDAAINLLMRSRSEKAAAVIAFLKGGGEKPVTETTKENNAVSNLFNEFAKRELRSLLWENEAWFSAYDICKILQYVNGREAVGNFCADEGKVMASFFPTAITSPLNVAANTIFIDFDNVMNLINRSKLPEAQAFRKFVSKVVIPSLYKTGVAFRSEEDKMEYDIDTFVRVAGSIEHAQRLNNLEYQKQKYKENKEWFAKAHAGQYDKFEGQAFVEFDKQRDAEYGLLSVKEAQKVAEQKRLTDDKVVPLPAALQNDKIRLNEYIQRGSALRACFKDEAFWLSLTDAERAEGKKELDMIERVTARFELLPCATKTQTLIVSTKPLPAVAVGARLTLAANKNTQYLASV